MDRLDELAIFVAIIDAGSLAAAARKLRRSAPAITRALNDLEKRLGVRLIERTTRRLAPTDAGRETAERARRLLTDYEAFVDEPPSAALRGLLRITAPLAFGRRHVTPVVARFLKVHPEVQIELTLNDRNVDLIANDLHLAIRIGRLEDSGMLARRVGEVRRVLVASPDYIAKRGAPTAPGDLTSHDIVMATGAQSSTEWRFGSGESASVVRLTPRFMVNDVEAMLIAVRGGHGVGRALSYQIVDDLSAGSLIRLLPEAEPPPLPVQIVAPGNRHMAPKVRVFFDHAVDELSRLPVIRGADPLR